MKKYLMTGVAAVALCAAFTSCSNKDDIEVMTQSQIDKAKYDQAFLKYIGGSVASGQDWGFSASANSRMTRSQAAPTVPNITKPYDEAWVSEYKKTAYEPTEANVNQNATNFQYPTWGWSSEYQTKRYTTGFDTAEQAFYDANIKPYDNGNIGFYGENMDYTKAWYEVYKRVTGSAYSSWANVTAEPTYVLNFKITGTYSGGISVVATEGYTDGVANGCERTVVVTGTWNITGDQKVGSLGKIIIANGGTVNVASGKTLSMVNQARLVVLPGGTLTGAGKVEVNNGNAEGLENYNGGTIDVAVFNNNFGKFYNYGKFLVNEYQGGAQESNFYNHNLAAIDHFGGSTANARIFNGCQFYVKNNARIRNYEGVGGSALIVGGELMFSSSEDGTSTPTYVGLAAGALVKCGTFYNNGTSWTGPASGYAALEITDKITFLNWEQDHPEQGGYFANNIYVKSATWNNVPGGNGFQAGETSTAEYKLMKIVANCVGNGGVKKVNDGDTELLPADDNFELGKDGCTPGFKGDEEKEEEVYDLRIMGEDLSASEDGDFDFNDIVIDVKFGSPAKVCLRAAGGTLPLYIKTANKSWEVHSLFNVATGVMVNTAAGKHKEKAHVVIEDFDMNVADAAEANNIKLIVVKNGEEQELTARISEPAAKIAVPITTDEDWLNERVSIKDVKKEFVNWATENRSRSTWWTGE